VDGFWRITCHVCVKLRLRSSACFSAASSQLRWVLVAGLPVLTDKDSIVEVGNPIVVPSRVGALPRPLARCLSRPAVRWSQLLVPLICTAQQCSSRRAAMGDSGQVGRVAGFNT
jgi:hypothetical protein